VTVVDVEKGDLLPDQTILVEGELIRRIAPRAELPVPAAARTIEAAGLFVIPGLVDAHVHYVDPETYGPMFIANGVTLVRDMGGPTESVVAMRDRLQRREMLGPEMVVTGAILDGDPPIWPFSETCPTPERAREAVRKLIGLGVDQLKVYSLLPRESYFAILDEARKAGIKAVGHVPDSITLEDAVEAGQASVEHLTGFPGLIARLTGKAEESRPNFRQAFSFWNFYPKVDRDGLKVALAKLKSSGAVQCPTLVVIRGIGRGGEPDVSKDPRLQYVSPMFRAMWNSDRYKFATWAKAAFTNMQALVGDLH
jgi:hypothetical protein